jgi:hypothetical protein
MCYISTGFQLCFSILMIYQTREGNMVVVLESSYLHTQRFFEFNIQLYGIYYFLRLGCLKA